MFVKKSVLVICSICLVIVTALAVVMAVNPFGALHFGDFLKFGTGVGALRHYYYEEIDSEKLLDGALMGAAYSVEDPYTVYMGKEAAESFMESVESDDYTGVGLYISNDSEDNRVTVVSPLSDSPAEAAGIVTGDKILEVNGQPVSGENIDEVASKMKGPAGTQVKLKVLKRTTGKTVELELTRANIKRETVSSKILDDNVGYLQITQFGVNTASEFAQHFNNLTDEGMSSLVVDLRNNPGGYMEMAVEIADFFIEEGKIVYTLNKYGEERIYEATKGATEVPMVILTNEGSASASEIFVGAMKDYGLAKVVGEKTYGKGVTQIPYPLYDGSILKITDSRYYTPSGVCIDKEGIEPDIVVDMDDEDYYSLTEPSTEDDVQLKKAVEVLVK